MNKLERALRASNNIINGRSWTTYRRPGGMEISELHDGSYYPNHWDGKSENARVFALLDSVARWRRQAHAQRMNLFARGRCIEQARDSLERARGIALPDDDAMHESLPHLSEAAE